MSLRVAVLAIAPERQRALADQVEAAGHRVVEGEAEIVVVDGDGASLAELLRDAAERLPQSDSTEGGFAAVSDAPLLTPRELEILTKLGDGLSNKEVARALNISAHTVKFHLETIFRKLDATSRAEAVAKGLRQGIIEL